MFEDVEEAEKKEKRKEKRKNKHPTPRQNKLSHTDTITKWYGTNFTIVLFNFLVLYSRFYPILDSILWY